MKNDNMKQFLKYRTSIIRYSVKKMKSVSRDLKGMNLNKCLDVLEASPKRVCGFLLKDIKAMKFNMLNVLMIDSKIIDNITIGFVVIEKKRKQLGTRFKARGRGSRACVFTCSLSLYFTHADISDFSKVCKQIEKVENSEANNKQEEQKADTSSAKKTTDANKENKTEEKIDVTNDKATESVTTEAESTKEASQTQDKEEKPK